jgi:hypothetical protein
MVKRIALLLTVALLSGTTPRFPAFAQNRRDNNQRFYNGAQRGVRGGDYGRDRRHYHDDNYRDNQGGIGPGKGALIGGAAGAALGAVFGGGVKGTLITGAAGAGIGAVIGQAAQNNRDQNNYYRR